MTSLHALELAEHIVADGFAAREDDVTALNDVAVARHLSPVLIDVVADATAPRPVRERALGRLVVQISRAA